MIYGIQKLSLVDYPKKPAFVIFLGGCNFRCGFCHNRGIVEKKFPEIPLADVISLLEERRNFLDAVVITGGEPTIYGQRLIELLDKIHSMGFTIKLDTNGTNPKLIQKILNLHLINYIAMDIKSSYGQYEKVTSVPIHLETIKESISLIENADIAYEFRMTINKTMHSKKQIEEVLTYIKDSSRFFLQPYHYNENQLIDKNYGEFSDNELKDLKTLYQYQIKKS